MNLYKKYVWYLIDSDELVVVGIADEWDFCSRFISEGFASGLYPVGEL